MRVERIAASAASLALACLLACGAVVAAAQEAQPSQQEAASKTAKFGAVEKTDALYKGALEAHDMEGAAKLEGKEGSFRGTVTKAFEQRGLVVLDFDPNYRTALTAVVRAADYAKFPALRDLEGKEIVVTGKFTEYRGRPQVELTDPAQIKLVK